MAKASRKTARPTRKPTPASSRNRAPAAVRKPKATPSKGSRKSLASKSKAARKSPVAKPKTARKSPAAKAARKSPAFQSKVSRKSPASKPKVSRKSPVSKPKVSRKSPTSKSKVSRKAPAAKKSRKVASTKSVRKAPAAARATARRKARSEARGPARQATRTSRSSRARPARKPRSTLANTLVKPNTGTAQVHLHTGPSWERHVVKLNVPFPLREFDLAAMSDAELEACSKALGIRLSLQEMKDARAYFQAKGRQPTDVEMEALGQAWSEHCCYKSSKPVLKRHVYGIAEGKIICREDAGVLPFDGDWYYSPKLESHNHPSAVEPYGGAATGIGGVIRDVVCMGAQPVALVDPLFFGPLDIATEALPPGVKHPRYLLSGVVDGIRDYGNRVGIPTVAGGITFHPGYTGNCLVNVGCVGVLHKSQLTHSRAGGVGDVFVYLGNATGRDGIHGVAFASEELTEASEEASRSAVQVGDAILKEPLIHTTLDIIQEGLATGCKDFGGGGLSCVAGELAFDAGFGCEIDLDQVPLKVPTMAPWEIWVSESQERMMVTAKPANVERILQIARKWDVPARVVGKVIPEPINRVTYRGHRVLEFDLTFSTGGPVYARPVQARPVNRDAWLDFPVPRDLDGVLLAMMAHPNVMSKEWVIRQYDHEVRANTVLKPLQGVIGQEGPGDAAVLKPVKDSNKGLAICSDVNPNFTSRDPYWGAASAVDEVVRNLAAVGARVDSFCDNLNFGNPEKPERMWELEESARGLGDMARALDVPFASGNVSLYNEGPSGPIPPTPTMMGVGILSHYKHATTMDLKRPGNLLFLFGKTHRELGGSLYLDHLRLEGERVPQSNPRFLKACADALVGAIEKGLVRSAHDCAEGGIAVTLAEMAFSGGLGARANLGPIQPGLRSDLKLFSESNTRWMIEVEPAKEIQLRAHLGAGAPLTELGEVTKEGRLIVKDGTTPLVDVSSADCRLAWSQALPKLMGVPLPGPPIVAPVKATRASTRGPPKAVRRAKGVAKGRVASRKAARPRARTAAKAPDRAPPSGRKSAPRRDPKSARKAPKAAAKPAKAASRRVRPLKAVKAAKGVKVAKAAKAAKAVKAAKGTRGVKSAKAASVRNPPRSRASGRKVAKKPKRAVTRSAKATTPRAKTTRKARKPLTKARPKAAAKARVRKGPKRRVTKKGGR